jgi:hypothetical protein
MSSAKETNNDWSAESTYFGNDFVATVRTEGNEAEGEIPQVNAQFAVRDQLTNDDTSFEADNRPDSANSVHTPVEKTRTFSTTGVDMTLSLAGSEEIIEDEFEELAEAVEESLPEDWEQTE